MRSNLSLSILVLLLGARPIVAEEGKPQLSKAPVVWAASDANKVHPISGNVLEEHYWHQQDEGGEPYFADPSYQGPRSGKFREKSTIWDAASRRICVRAAGNEFVSFQVIVERAETPLKGIRLAVSDLAGPGGASIRADRNIQVFAEHYIQVLSRAKDVWDPASYYGDKYWFPDGLIPVTAKGWDKVDLPEPRLQVPGQAVQGFWVDVYVPHKAKPGTYKGKVMVTADAIPPQVLDLQLEVLPWELPDEVSYVFELNTYGTGFAKSFEAGSEADVARIEQAFHKMAHEHRCTLNIFPGWPTTRDRPPQKVVDQAYVPKTAGEGADLHVVDWSGFDQRFEKYFTGQAFQDCPRKGVPLTHFYLPFSLGWPSDFNNYYDNREKYEAEYIAMLKEFDKHLAEKGWKNTQFQIYYNGKKGFGEPWNTDEPTQKDEYDALRYYGQLLIKATGKRQDRASNIRYRVDIGTYSTTKDQFDGIIDLRVVNYSVTPEAFWGDWPNGMKATRAKLGDQWWHYAIDPLRQRHTRLDWAMMSPIIYGWSGWDLKTQGFCLWDCMRWDQEDPFNRAGPVWNYVALWYPGHKFGIEGPIPTMRLKGFRRGLQDYEHLAYLTKLNKGDSSQADAILNKYYKLANAAPYSIKVEAEDAYKMRYEVLAAIGSALERPKSVTLSAANAAATVDPATGRVTSVLLNGVEEMAAPHSAGSDTPYGYLEVTDLRDHRTYNPMTAASKISDWKVTGHGDVQEVSFCQQYEDAPFQVVHTLRPTPAGLRWQASLRLLPGQDQNRSLVVTWALPLPSTWQIWGPSNLEVHTTDGVTPYRYVYAHTDFGSTATILPLVGVWGKNGGAALFSPPDIRKSQIIFEVQTQGVADVATGVHRGVEDLQTLKVAHHMIGLRPGKDLTLAVCVAGTRPDWRGVLGHYVSNYPELFEPIPQTRQWEGMYGVTTPHAWAQGDSMKRRTQTLLTSAHATCVELHGHFLEYGHFIEQDLIDNPDREFRCRPHPSGPLTYSGNRRVVEEMVKAGAGPFIYFYNVHSLPDTIEKRYPGEMLLDEQGKPELQWYTEPAVVAQPDSAYGKNLLDQLRLLIQAYPQAPGFFVDNYSIQKIGFNHDDGVTMVHNRPCYDLNRNHQDIGTRCFEIAHQAGKIMMVNKLATIESARGADMVLLEGVNATTMAINAFACVNRPFFPLGWEDPDKEHMVERGLQQLLIWGGTPGAEYAANAPDCMKAYRPLTDAMIGKRWVFDADPLTLPAGYQGQIFRIDPHAPHAGDVVVTLVDPSRSWKDTKPMAGLTATVRLPEAEQLTRICYLPVEKSAAQPIVCQFTREGQAISVALPPAGAAGVLRLSRPATADRQSASAGLPG